MKRIYGELEFYVDDQYVKSVEREINAVLNKYSTCTSENNVRLRTKVNFNNKVSCGKNTFSSGDIYQLEDGSNFWLITDVTRTTIRGVVFHGRTTISDICSGNYHDIQKKVKCRFICRKEKIEGENVLLTLHDYYKYRYGIGENGEEVTEFELIDVNTRCHFYKEMKDDRHMINIINELDNAGILQKR